MAPSGTFWFRKLESEWVNTDFDVILIAHPTRSLNTTGMPNEADIDMAQTVVQIVVT